MTVPGAKPKLGLPGSPGVVSVGHDLHRGFGYKNAVIDDYPIKFGLRKSTEPVGTSKQPGKRRYYMGPNGGANAG